MIEERNFCPRCGKRTKDIHTCTPPQEEAKQEPVIDKSAAIRIATALGWKPKREPLTDDEIEEIAKKFYPRSWGLEGFARAIEAAHGIMGEA